MSFCNPVVHSGFTRLVGVFSSSHKTADGIKLGLLIRREISLVSWLEQTNGVKIKFSYVLHSSKPQFEAIHTYGYEVTISTKEHLEYPLIQLTTNVFTKLLIALV